MANVTVKITDPAHDSAEVEGRKIKVKGTAEVRKTGVENVIFDIQVKLGENGTFVDASGGANWEHTFTLPPGSIDDSSLKITAKAIGFVSRMVQGEWVPDFVDRSDYHDISPKVSRTFRPIDKKAPEITIGPHVTEITPESLPFRMVLSGTARDDDSQISSVTCQLKDNLFTLADNKSGDWSQWEKVFELSAGEYQIKVKAIDRFKNKSDIQSAFISIRTPFKPLSAELALKPVTYLQDLTWFSVNWIRIGNTETGPDSSKLTGNFFQPFDRLVQIDTMEQASRPVLQARIAVDVLLGKLAAMNGLTAPNDEEKERFRQIKRNFRQIVYEAFLLQLGTSYKELRSVRIVDEQTRKNLAERLGFGTENKGLERLRRITLTPGQIDDDFLKHNFGFENIFETDNLGAAAFTSKIFDWRLEVIRQRWMIEDAERKNATGELLPIIDPDLIRESQLIAPLNENPVFPLWQVRQNELDDKLTEAKSQRSQGFEFIISSFIGVLEIPALAEEDNSGQNITEKLKPFKLTLDAFRFLVQYRKLDQSGEPLLDFEWDDIFAIVVQTHKKQQYERWRNEEKEVGLILDPNYFNLSDGQFFESDPKTEPSIWRKSVREEMDLKKILNVRSQQIKDFEKAHQAVTDKVEAQTLPVLRNNLLKLIGEKSDPPEKSADTAERLSRELLIDFRFNTPQKISRLDQAIETLQDLLFSIRTDRLKSIPESEWTIPVETESRFDQQWQWMGMYRTWIAAMMVFAYPENYLNPGFFVTEKPFLNPTESFQTLLKSLQKTNQITPANAQKIVEDYLKELTSKVSSLPQEIKKELFITDKIDLVGRKKLVKDLFDKEESSEIKELFLEIFWLVPMSLAMQMQKDGNYLAALDWYQTVYAFNLPPENRKIYRGLELEEEIETEYVRVPEWLIEELNPHIFARKRRNAYTRFTVLSIVQCFLDYADSEFSQTSIESMGRARTMYETAIDLLNLDDFKPKLDETKLFPTNPVLESLRLHAKSNLAKIHNGLNIAGVSIGTSFKAELTTRFRPSQYRYAMLAERAKQLVNLAQQVESSFMNAMERSDAEAYNLLQAGHDIQVAKSSVNLQELKIVDANLMLQTAKLQHDKAQIQTNFYDQRLKEGLNHWEESAISSMDSAVWLQTGAAVLFTAAGVGTAFSLGAIFGNNPIEKFGQALSAFAGAASSSAQLAQTRASFERREQEWHLQKSLSEKDVQISRQQTLLAQNQHQIAEQEFSLALSQLNHAAAVVNFLTKKRMNVELYEWMSGVLGRVYNYFLQQATAMAKLAQSQLAFERQETPLSVIQSDYWQVSQNIPLGGTNGKREPDRFGLTGSARLLQDLYQLDQYAFETKQRKLQITQTISLAQYAPLELQNLRDTGHLIMATPLEIFDREFPGHYLRLIRRVTVSVVALVPPTRGIRATLSASGISRVVTGGETFDTVEIHRAPETISFTSPLNATGLFELEPEVELLQPFEGMGVDTFWEFQLPKAANPFDYRAIADILLTIEYTALSDENYRQKIIKQLDPVINGDRLFSLREQFPDAWYLLNNPDTVENSDQRMIVEFSTVQEDFPLSLKVEELEIQHITFLVSRQSEFKEELNITLTFDPQDTGSPIGGNLLTFNGIVSTRRNAYSWNEMQGKSPIGKWKLQLHETNLVKTWLNERKIKDIILIITFSGISPSWE